MALGLGHDLDMFGEVHLRPSVPVFLGSAHPPGNELSYVPAITEILVAPDPPLEHIRLRHQVQTPCALLTVRIYPWKVFRDPLYEYVPVLIRFPERPHRLSHVGLEENNFHNVEYLFFLVPSSVHGGDVFRSELLPSYYEALQVVDRASYVPVRPGGNDIRHGIPGLDVLTRKYLSQNTPYLVLGGVAEPDGLGALVKRASRGAHQRIPVVHDEYHGMSGQLYRPYYLFLPPPVAKILDVLRIVAAGLLLVEIVRFIEDDEGEISLLVTPELTCIIEAQYLVQGPPRHDIPYPPPIPCVGCVEFEHVPSHVPRKSMGARGLPDPGTACENESGTEIPVISRASSFSSTCHPFPLRGDPFPGLRPFPYFLLWPGISHHLIKGMGAIFLRKVLHCHYFTPGSFLGLKKGGLVDGRRRFRVFHYVQYLACLTVDHRHLAACPVSRALLAGQKETEIEVVDAPGVEGLHG